MSALWLLMELTTAGQLVVERSRLIKRKTDNSYDNAWLPEGRVAYHGDLLIDQHAKENPKVAAFQRLKTNSEHAFLWESHWPKEEKAYLHVGEVVLTSDGRIRHYLGSFSNLEEEQSIRPGVVFYREAEFCMASGSVIWPKEYGERILNNFQDLSKQVWGEDSIYIHEDLSQPAILLLLQAKEIVGKDNTLAYAVVVMTSDVYDRRNEEISTPSPESN